jgi:hypothetical protein
MSNVDKKQKVLKSLRVSENMFNAISKSAEEDETSS